MMFFSRCTDVPYSSKPNTLTQATVGAVCDGEIMNNNSCWGFCLSFSLIEKKKHSLSSHTVRGLRGNEEISSHPKSKEQQQKFDLFDVQNTR